MILLSKKNKVIIIAAAVLLIAIMTVEYAGDGLVRVSDDVYINSWVEKNKTLDNGIWEEITQGEIICENENVRFEMDSNTTHFTVTDLKSGVQYSSVAPEMDSYLLQRNEAEMTSEVFLSYYDSQSNESYVGSSTDSVNGGSYIIKRKDNSIRVYYTFGEMSVSDVLPAAFSKEGFENNILPALDINEQRRLKGYYYYISSDDPTGDYATYIKQYPYLKNNSMYILRDSPTETQISEIMEYMAKAKYSLKQYNVDAKLIGAQVAKADLPSAFITGIEYSLTNNGFSAEILTDSIVANNKEDTVQKISLLGYFGSCDSSKPGYMMIPDGSGSIIELGKTTNVSYSQKLYGVDQSKKQTETTQFLQTASLPVFGFNQNNNGFFAVVEEAAEVCTITANTIGSENLMNSVYPSFEVRELEKTDIGSAQSIPILNQYSNHILYKHPKVQYHLLSGEDATYSGMAKYYRRLLLERGDLKLNTNNNNVPLYIDFSCLITKKTNILGITLNKNTVLSTIKSISDTVEKLKAEGVKNIDVRLKGVGNSGLSNAIFNRFDLDKSVGSIKEFHALLDTLGNNGNQLSVDTDFSYVHTDGVLDGFSQTTDVSKHIDKSLVNNGNYDIVTLKYRTGTNYRFFLSPFVYQSNVSSYIQSMNKVLGEDSKRLGISWGTAGSDIGGDYDKNRCYDLTMTSDKIKAAYQLLSDGHKTITDVGNSYVLSETDQIRNMSLNDSEFEFETLKIPFYQMVVRGCIEYSGTPLNISANPERQLLRSIECGAEIYWTWITGEDRLLLDSEYNSQLYSLNVDNSISKATKLYKELYPLYSQIGNSAIVKHEQLAKDVFQTTYENGVNVIVNYNEIAYQAGEKIVEAGGYLAIIPENLGGSGGE